VLPVVLLLALLGAVLEMIVEELLVKDEKDEPTFRRYDLICVPDSQLLATVQFSH
jgi:hypothetical protein